jgi:hypothetical protein
MARYFKSVATHWATYEMEKRPKCGAVHYNLPQSKLEAESAKPTGAYRQARSAY